MFDLYSSEQFLWLWKNSRCTAATRRCRIFRGWRKWDYTIYRECSISIAMELLTLKVVEWEYNISVPMVLPLCALLIVEWEYIIYWECIARWEYNISIPMVLPLCALRVVEWGCIARWEYNISVPMLLPLCAPGLLNENALLDANIIFLFRWYYRCELCGLLNENIIFIFQWDYRYPRFN